MNEAKYKKGDYVKCEAIDLSYIYIVKLLEDSYKNRHLIRAKVEVILINQIKEDYIHNDFILEGEHYTSKKIPYMNTALYNILNKENNIE